MSIENEIRKGNFVMGQCTKCDQIVWPPADYCNVCFGKTMPKNGPFKGKIIEFSKQDKDYFCLVEFEKNVRVIGKISTGTPMTHQKVKVEKCGIKDGSYFFEFSLI